MDLMDDFFENNGTVQEIVQESTIDCMPIYTTMDMPEDLNLPWNVVNDMGEREFETFTERLRVFLLDRYEKDRTPMGGGNISLEKITKNLKNLNKLDITDPKVFFMEGDKPILKGYSNAGNSVNHWFPEMRDVKLTKGIDGIQYSIIDQLRDLKLYKSKIHRILKKDALKEYKKKPERPIFPTLANCFKIVSGAQPLTNIRCPVAKWIWQSTMLESDSNELVVFDPSMGWAGRLVAFLAASSHPNLKGKRCVYIGTDPNKEIFERYKMVETFWKKYVDTECTAEVYPINCGSEDFHKTKEFKEFQDKGLVAYTSPPYFNRERYSDDETQSYKKFGNYKDWRDGFLYNTMENAFNFLEPGGKLFWNVADIRLSSKITLPIEKDSTKIAEQIGFENNGMIYMSQRSFPGRDDPEKMKKMVAAGMNFIEVDGRFIKFEPVLMFNKGRK